MAQYVIDYEIDLFNLYENIDNRNAFLFESSLINDLYGRYSILLFNPNKIAISNSEIKKEVFNIKIQGQCKNIIDCFLNKEGIYAGYISYEYGYQILNIKNNKLKDCVLPQIYFNYYKNYIIVDHKNKKTYIQTDNKKILEIIRSHKKSNVDRFSKDIHINSIASDNTIQEYIEKVERIKRYIYEGDVYQVNLSQRFNVSGTFDALKIYSTLRVKNAAYYSAFLNIDKNYIISNSPELFIKTENNTIITKPIKGTIKRGENPHEDKELKRQLFKSAKDRSELLMIVDLERNDLSKICKPGTVNVTKLYGIEAFATVNHLVSTIKGQLLPQTTFFDIIKAMFPGGSITGAPKIRSMEIISELEKNPRSVYTGIIGLITDSGYCNFNIAIRTLIISRELGFFNVGGGIVWDSDPQQEYEETLHKGKAFLNLFSGDNDDE